MLLILFWILAGCAYAGFGFLLALRFLDSAEAQQLQYGTRLLMVALLTYLWLPYLLLGFLARRLDRR